jgi:hypothetical protein
MADLLDVNVLVALLLPEHQHHPASMEWFTTRAGPNGWATCAVTELGVIRVCAQLPGGAWPAETTADRLLLLTATGRDYMFWPDAVSPAVMPEVRTASTGKADYRPIPPRPRAPTWWPPCYLRPRACCGRRPRRALPVAGRRVGQAPVTSDFVDFATLIWPTSIPKSGPPATLTDPSRSQRDRGGSVGQESPRGAICRDSTGVSVRHRDD